jgi:lipoprotein-releasing system permease protein
MTAAGAERAEPIQPPKPFAAFEWLLAFRYLKARRKEGFISVIAGFSFFGIMLGVATLIVVMSVMNGFRKELINKILGINGHVFVQALDTPLNDYATLAERFSSIRGVRMAVPMIEGQVLASTPFAAAGALVRGIREPDLKRLSSVADNIRAGSLEGFDSGEGVAIGRRLADHLGIRAGDRITLLAPSGPVGPFGPTPRRKTYNVGAVFEIGMSEFDAAFVFMPFAEAQLYFNKEGEASVIELFVDNPDRVEDTVAQLNSVAERQFLANTWKQRNRTFFGALEVERNVMFLILTLIVLVAALNIVSGLIMLVKDKSHDIAILRTMGASRGNILRVFLITGASIGVVGTCAGFGLGVLLASNIETIRSTVFPNTFPAELYFLSRLPAEIDPREVAAVVAMALSLSLLATLYPAWRAAKLDPVEALRYE